MPESVVVGGRKFGVPEAVRNTRLLPVTVDDFPILHTISCTNTVLAQREQRGLRQMKIVMTTIQKIRLDAVSEALMGIGVKNITASEVTSLNDEGVFATMTKIEAVVDDNEADAAVNAIAQASLSGDSGPIQIVGCEQQQRQEPQRAEAEVPAPPPAPEPVSVTIGGSSSLTTERSGQTLIVSAKGRIDGTNANEVQGVLSSAIEPGVKLMLLDLGGLTYISSAGLRVIMLTARTLDRSGAKFAVGSPAGPIREVFQISGFDQIIPIFDSQAEAIESLGS